MPVQIIGPNRLRFVEDPKPPDPAMDGVGDMDMEGVNVDEEREEEETEDEVIMVDETVRHPHLAWVHVLPPSPSLLYHEFVQRYVYTFLECAWLCEPKESTTHA